MDVLSGGSDVYGRLQKINKIAAEQIKNEIESGFPNFAEDVNRIWEIIEKFLYGKDEEIADIVELREKLNSFSSAIKSLKIKTPETEISLEEQKEPAYSTLFHYADLYGLEPYYLVDDLGDDKKRNLDEDFVDSVISNIKYSKSCLERAPVSEDEEKLSLQIKNLENLISETESEELLLELKLQLSEISDKLFALKKKKPFFTKNLDEVLQKLEYCDFKNVETPLPLLEDSKCIIPNLEPLEEDGIDRCEIQLCDPSSDSKFNEEIFLYASNGKTIEDAPILHWTEYSNPFFVPSKLLPRDILVRIKEIKNEEYNKWEYSSVYTKDEDDNRRLCERYKNHFSNVFRRGEIEKLFKPQDGVFDEETSECFRSQVDSGEINIDIDKMLQISPVFNPFYFIPVRDEKSGEILDYKVGLKNLEQREREAMLRGDLKFWIEDDEFPRPMIYGWKSPKIQEDDEEEDEDDAMSFKPKEKKVKRSDPQLLREEVLKLLENICDEALIVDEEVTPSMKKANDVLKSLVLESVQVPFECLDDLLDSLALDFNSRQNLKIDRPDEKIQTEKWIEETIDENFENVKNFDTSEPLPLVSSKSIFQELISQLDETEDKEMEVDIVKSDTSEKFVQGSKACLEENTELLSQYESLHGESGRGEIFTQHPDEKHETIDLENTLESFESKYLTYPYFSTDVFQPDALLIRRLLQKINGFQNLSVAKPEISLELQKGMLETVRKDSDSAIFEFENVKDPSGKYLKCKTIEKSIAEGKKLVDDFFNFSSDEVLEEDFEIDFDCDFEMAPNVESVKLKVEPIELDVEKLLEGFDLDSDCEEFQEDDNYALKCLDNNYEFAKTQDFNESSDDETDENSDDEIDENTFMWAPLKSGDKFDAEKLLLKSLMLIDTPNVNYGKSRREKFKTWIRESNEIDHKKLIRFMKDCAKVDPHFFDGFDRALNSPDYEENEEEEEEIASQKPNVEKEDVFKEIGRAEENSVEPKLVKLKESKIFVKQEFVEEIDTNIPVDVSSIEMAHRYNFELDTFQKAAIKALEDDNHVFVSAHTSAGKTVVAEYAIAMARRNSTRVIYTSPIKALSNQKFYDFRKKFDHGEKGISVGLITGDVQINENARCLIMTTEILRSMIYNCPEKINDLEFVIFDEVHYLNDPDRGHVWEECIILLPDRVKIVMLSATVPNALQFSSWIGKTKKRKVVICSTRFRPVPLQHYILDFDRQEATIEEMSTLVKNGEQPLSKLQFDEHKKGKKKAKPGANKYIKQERKTNKTDTEFKNQNNSLKGKPPNLSTHKWSKLIECLKTSQKLPVVIFVFSRKMCDELASECNVDLTDSDEKAKIELFFKKHISSKLEQRDRDLPQVKLIKKLLLKGIGVHHSGILPMLKEIVECLFGESIVKVLFATETFAMGVNMPARTVIFKNIDKFDKKGKRVLEPGEYIQMAGRAGRRGKDSVGYVYILEPPEIEYSSLESMMEGKPKALSSQFKIFYRTILNIYLKREHMSVKTLLDRSFLSNETNSNHDNIEKDYQECLKSCKSLKECLEESVSSDERSAYSEFYEKIEDYFNNVSLQLETFSQTIEIGRLVRFTHEERVNKIGVVLCKYLVKDVQNITVLFFEDSSYEKFRPKTVDSIHLLDWFRYISFFPFLEKDSIVTDTSFKVLNLNLEDVLEVCIPKLKKSDVSQINDYFKKLKTVHPSAKRPEYVTEFTSYLYQIIKGIKQSRMIDKLFLSSNAMSEINSVDSLENFEHFFKYQMEQLKLNDLRKKVSQDCDDLAFLSKRDVLHARQFIDDKGEVLIKGQIASRISKFEIIISEILVENVLADLKPSEIASLLSCFVHEKKEEFKKEELEVFEHLPEKLVEAIEAVKKICLNIEKTEKLNRIDLFDGHESDKISFKIAPIIYNWAQGMSFGQILQMEEAAAFQEGIIIRFIIQLLEVLKEIEAAAKIMADGTIREKIQAAAKALKRDIVFTPSLYTQVESGSDAQNKNK